MSSTEPIKAAEDARIFNGKKFWVERRCPLRSEYIKTIKYLGGEEVSLDKHADYIIVDHARKNNTPGSISFQWIEESYRKGELQPLEDYVQGPSNRASRAVGSTKSSRTPYTPEDDSELWEWVQEHGKAGARLQGNEIYKGLERKVSNRCLSLYPASIEY